MEHIPPPDQIDVARRGDTCLLVDMTHLGCGRVDRVDLSHAHLSAYQSLIQGTRDLTIVLLTQNTVPCIKAASNVCGVLLSSLVRSLSAEYPHVTGRCIDIDEAGQTDLPQLLTQELSAPVSDGFVCVRNGDRYVSTLDASEPIETMATQDLDPAGLYLISGDPRGDGLSFAAH